MFKNYKCCAIVLALLLIISMQLASSADSFVFAESDTNVVHFQDSNLEEIVRNSLNKPTGDITEDDMLKLKVLHGYYSNISDLTGLEFALNLEEVRLHDNQVSNITPLSGLTNLWKIELSHNQISDIAALSNLTKLQYLDLMNNQITDITALNDLTDLNELFLMNNQISDITPLSDKTRLWSLYLSDNQISDITALSGLSNLRYLPLSLNRIGDITPLSGLTNLESLYLVGNEISDITPLINLKSLENLDLGDNQINDITMLNNNLGSLKALSLNDNQISSIPVFSASHTLKTLNLSNNQISDITPLNQLKWVTSLDLSNNQISDITPLESLTSIGLKTLSLQENKIDISPGSSYMQIINEFISFDTNVYYTPQSIQTHYIYVDASPWDEGTVSGEGYYPQGTQVTVSAIPNQGYKFVNWTEGNVEVSTQAQYNFTVTSDRNLVAHFAENPFNGAVWDKKITTDDKKIWTINFNKTLDPSSITDANIYIVDTQGNLIPTELELSSTKTSVKVSPAQNFYGYKWAQTYYLYILKEIQSENGENLEESIKMPFVYTDFILH